ncbi:F-box/kelch-repeat protein At3g23880-like [Silene latifolia]|uniref:F-box/kelch-repeat protein At3g23880-like n=1 Tax=Silene latifolia TaxID=37657 RepID=UPI003D76EF34
MLRTNQKNNGERTSIAVCEEKKAEMEGQNKDEKDIMIQPTEERDLPFDLISEMILTRLPIKSIIRFKSVSKLWYSTLSSHRFAFLHLKFPNPSITESLIIRSDDKFQIMSYENGDIDLFNVEVDFDVGDESMILVGTCNGLVCFGSTCGRLFILLNPITREFRKYLDSEISNLFTTWYSVGWGFGYLSAVDDYKIVRICKEWLSTSYMVHIYSFRLDKWRIIDNIVFPYPLYDSRSGIRSSAVLVNETLCWMGFSGLPGIIISFDLESEMFNKFSHFEVSTLLSYVTSQDECIDKLLFVVNGCLSRYDKLLSGDIVTILRSPGVIEEIILPMDLTKMIYFEKIIGFSRSDKVFVVCFDNDSEELPYLGVIDITWQPLKLTPLMTLEAEHKIEFFSYCASLISPNAHVIRTREGRDEHSNI